MADNTQQAAPAVVESPSTPFTPASGFPPPFLPTVYADGILSVSPSSNVFKIYLYRTMPEVSGKNEFANQASAQIVMPLDGFILSFAFMEYVLNGMIANKTLDADKLEAARASIVAATNK